MPKQKTVVIPFQHATYSRIGRVVVSSQGCRVVSLALQETTPQDDACLPSDTPRLYRTCQHAH